MPHELPLSEASQTSPLSIGECAALACLLEATAPKPGNVHRGVDFEDVTYPEFVASGIAIAPVLDRAASVPFGQTVLSAVHATRRVARTNTNLGTILLLAPLAAVPRERALAAGVVDVLSSLTPGDARDIYAAIRLAAPGGLGRVAEADVADLQPPANLVAAMRLAAERDLVARQYAENFHQVFECVVPWLTAGLSAGLTTGTAIVHAQLQLMSAFPDSLIARKCGLDVARRSAAWAAKIVAAGEPGSEPWHERVADFDFWLRSDGHRRNPGSTADLLTAGLFAALRGGLLPEPLVFA
jgi:triphosphoribosyl-dephospho-CoA synthase